MDHDPIARSALGTNIPNHHSIDNLCYVNVRVNMIARMYDVVTFTE